MKKSTMIAALCVVSIGVAVWALAAPDFSGTWVLDASKSDQMSMGRQGGGSPPNITLTLKQSGNELAITRTMEMGGNQRTSEQKFTLDGKENTNSGMMGRGEMVSKSRWDGDTLVIEGTQKMSSSRGEMEIATKEAFSLSEDGKVLTITTTRTTPQGERTTKQVYNKQ
jgi:hypothetical protein